MSRRPCPPSQPFAPQSGLKMKAFTLNMSGKKLLSKKDQEKQKQAEDEAAAALAYDDFVKTFDQPVASSKMFVKEDAAGGGGAGEKDSSESRSFYQTAKLQDFLEKKAIRSHDPGRSVEAEKTSSQSAKKGKEKEKKKSNLELFKEELKMIQKEREERHKLKGSLTKKDASGRVDPIPDTVKLVDEYRVPGLGSFDTGDPNTTNIYLGNISPKITEQQLMDIFGKYGPLASVKIMWPRTDEERARNRNCGFVAFMCRRDGEKALRCVNGKEFMGYEMKLGWGKAVPIPPHPVYIPSKLLELTLPPPVSGLPFNAQPAPADADGVKPGLVTPQNANDDFIKGLLSRAAVKVVIPTDRTVLCLIHRMVEFVVNEGPLFEAMIMNRELHNPAFRFLFDNASPAHVYYRWRLFSVLQGEQQTAWRTKEFRMYEGGSTWKPPPVNLFAQGMPDELIDVPVDEADRLSKLTEDSEIRNPKRKERDLRQPKKAILTETQRAKLEDLLRNLTPEKQKIADAMIYAVNHANAAEEVAECITESLTIAETPIHKKIARLYLISDILHNCAVEVANASLYRKCFQNRLETICYGLKESLNSIEGRLKAEHFKQRVLHVFRVWEEWAVYPSDQLVSLQYIFLGLMTREKDRKRVCVSDDVDGIPLEDVDVDGVPLDEQDAASVSGDGSCNAKRMKFKPSKWETVD